MQLNNPIDYDADGKPVDLTFALLIPENQCFKPTFQF